MVFGFFSKNSENRIRGEKRGADPALLRAFSVEIDADGAVFPDVVGLNVEFLHPLLFETDLPRSGVGTFSAVIVPEPVRGGPETDLRRDDGVKFPCRSLLSVVGHLDGLGTEHFCGLEFEEFRTSFFSEVSEEEERGIFGLEPETDVRVVDRIALAQVRIVQHRDGQGAKGEFLVLPRRDDAVLDLHDMLKETFRFVCPDGFVRFDPFQFWEVEVEFFDLRQPIRPDEFR